MIRIKLPLGGITAEQMETFASVVEKYVPLDKGHITTRQNIQLHHVPLPDAAALIREISDAGLSSREGCGNTIRNVTGDPWAGVAPDEIFDPTEYAIAYVRYFVRHPTTQLMPRKIKTAFSSSDDDRAIVGIHDIGFLPRIKDGVKGFAIVVGGGTSIMPRIAPTLYEFVAADDGEYLRVTEAALRIFDRQNWLRVNRARARIKVLVDKIGMDEFRRMVDRELEGDWVGERDFSLDRLLPNLDEEGAAPPPAQAAATPNGDRSAFEAFLRRQRPGAAPAGLLDRAREDHPWRPHPRSSSAASARSCASTAAATPGRRSIRTSSCAGFATSRSTTSTRGSATSASPIPAPTRSPTSSRARGPTPARWASPPPWASTGRSRSDSRRWRSPIR